MMDKKFIYLNVGIIFLIILALIFGDYFSPIDMKFQFWWLTKTFEWQKIPVIFVVSIVFSSVISFQRIKKLKYKSKFLRVFFCINSLILIVLIYNSGKSYHDTKTELIKEENEQITKAKNDIQKDNITYEYGGFPLSMNSQKVESKIDSIHKKYGITYKNTGCYINLIRNQAQNKYDVTVKPYLEKRNGKNWETKMKMEVEKVERDFR